MLLSLNVETFFGKIVVAVGRDGQIMVADQIVPGGGLGFVAVSGVFIALVPSEQAISDVVTLLGRGCGDEDAAESSHDHDRGDQKA